MADLSVERVFACVGTGMLALAGAPASGQSQDFAESNPGQWSTFASDNAQASTASETIRKKDGASGIRFTTLSGFDTGVKFPADPNLNFNAASFNYLTFWEYPENSTPIGWQGEQPIVVITTGTGTLTLTPDAQFTPNFAWKLFKVPLAGGDGWSLSTTGSPDITDIDQIEIHHDTWDAGFSIVFDGVRFMQLDPDSLPPPGPPPPAGVDPDIIESRVLLYMFDPIMENFGGQRMHSVYGWQDPLELSEQIRQDFLTSSHGRARFQIVQTVLADEYPRFQDGFRHTDESFAEDWQNHIFHESTFDYVAFAQAHDLPARVDGGEFDEVWLYAPPIAGMYESCMAGQGGYWINGPTYPEAGGQRAYAIMGWNFERGVGEAIHSFGHRAEGMMVQVYGSWTSDRSNTWSRFALIDINAPGFGGVGNVHYPVNGESDYDYGNPRFVESNADAWLSYPDLNDDTRAINFHEWSPLEADTQREYLNWWYAHMPHVPGRAPDFYLANWWRYLLDTDQFKAGRPSLRLTIGQPSVEITTPEYGATVTGIVPVIAAAEVDGALGRVDFYIDGIYRGTDYIAPYIFEWNTAGAGGAHTLLAKAYELQNGTEGISGIVLVNVPCDADFDGSGFVDTDDFDAFVHAFEAGGDEADFDGSGFVDLDDFIAFMHAFESGC
ncbi:MAG: hypothetical protein IT435_15115 [Phycisphaerales bacterium]|nr:hypothetical protein [Phycisphaerales bacterium]